MIILQTIECPCSFFSVWVELLPLAIMMYLFSVALTSVISELLKIASAYRWTVMCLFQWPCAMWVRCWRLPQPTVELSCLSLWCVCFSDPAQCGWDAEDCHCLQLNLAVCHCDVSVSVTLRNVGEMLEIATAYNAVQLCQACQQFITLNLPALLESR